MKLPQNRIKIALTSHKMTLNYHPLLYSLTYEVGHTIEMVDRLVLIVHWWLLQWSNKFEEQKFKNFKCATVSRFSTLKIKMASCRIWWLNTVLWIFNVQNCKYLYREIPVPNIVYGYLLNIQLNSLKADWYHLSVWCR